MTCRLEQAAGLAVSLNGAGSAGSLEKGVRRVEVRVKPGDRANSTVIEGRFDVLFSASQEKALMRRCLLSPSLITRSATRGARFD